MAKKRQRRRRNRWVARVAAFFLIVVALVICYLVWDAYFRPKTEEQQTEGTKNTPVQVVEVEEKKEETSSEKTDGADEVIKPNEAIQYEGEDPNKLDVLTGAVTFAGVSGGKLVVRVNLDQYLDKGQCELALTRDGATLRSMVVEVMGAASTATCNGFDVALDGLGQGRTEIVVKVMADGKTGTIYGEVEL